MTAGTCSRYRCLICGREWTWRNTLPGRVSLLVLRYRHGWAIRRVRR